MHTLFPPARRLFIALLLLAPIGCGTATQPQTTVRAWRLAPATTTRADALRIAGVLGIAPLVERVWAVGNQAPMSVESLAARQQITMAILKASLAIDDVAAEVESESSAVTAVQRALLTDVGQRARRIAVAAAVFGIGNAVGDSLAVGAPTAEASTWVSAVASVLGAGIAVWAALAPTADRGRMSIHSAMLLPIVDPGASHPHYPAIVWRLLESAPPDDGATSRRESLIRRWEELGFLNPEVNPAARSKAALFGPLSAGMPQEPDTLEVRRVMLGHLLASILQMKQELAALAESIPGPGLSDSEPPGRRRDE